MSFPSPLCGWINQPTQQIPNSYCADSAVIPSWNQPFLHLSSPTEDGGAAPCGPNISLPALSGTCWRTLCTLLLGLSSLLFLSSDGWSGCGLQARVPTSDPNVKVLSSLSGYQTSHKGKKSILASSPPVELVPTYVCVGQGWEWQDNAPWVGRKGREASPWHANPAQKEAAGFFENLWVPCEQTHNWSHDVLILVHSPNAVLILATSMSFKSTHTLLPPNGERRTAQAYVTASIFPRNRAQQPF